MVGSVSGVSVVDVGAQRGWRGTGHGTEGTFVVVDMLPHVVSEQSLCREELPTV